MVIRFSDIQFLNSWPVTYALRKRLVGTRGTDLLLDVESSTPAQLNRRLLAGQLDAGAVSSMAYLRHQEEWVPVPGLCIRSDGGVASVLVVSRQPLDQLQGQRIALTNQGETTPVLLKLLLKHHGLRLEPEVTALRYPEILEKFPAALLIGDEALEASRESKELLRWDLGEAWNAWTGMPFVYAIWVIRRELVEQHPELPGQMSRLLEASRRWGRRHRRELVDRMREVFPWETSFLRSYLDKLSYDLDERAWAGLIRFAHEARGIQELILPAERLEKEQEKTVVEVSR